MTPADLIVVMLFNAVKHSKDRDDRQALVMVLGIMHHVVEALPGDNLPLLRYITQCIKQFNDVKNV
jgi:hypothetical protein